MQLFLDKRFEASIIVLLLLFSTALRFFQEHRSQATLAGLKSRLALTAWVIREGRWMSVPAANGVTRDALIVPASTNGATMLANRQAGK